MTTLAESSPLRLPIALGQARLVLARPLDSERPPAPKLRGAFGSALMRRACLSPTECRPGPPSGDEAPDERHPCRGASDCPVRFLLRPHSDAQGRDHPPPVAFGVAASPGRLDVGIVLWGRRARAQRPLVEAALVSGGTPGLLDAGGAVPYRASIAWAFEGTLGRWLDEQAPPPQEPVLLELVEPLESKARDLGAVAGNAAHDLVQWDLEDSGESARLGKRGCDEIADLARARARAAFAGVVVEDGWLEQDGPGPRLSRTNRRAFEPVGVRGYVRLAGDVAAAWPWLLLLTLRGAGGRRSFGLGAVRLWRLV